MKHMIASSKCFVQRKLAEQDGKHFLLEKKTFSL